MPPVRNRRRRRSLVNSLTYPLFILSVLIIALVGYTIWNGELRIPFLSDSPVFAFQRDEEPGMNPEEWVSVPLSSTFIPAYTQVRREHYWDAARQTLSFINLRRDSLPEGVVTIDDLDKLNGRVLAHDKKPSLAFLWSEFLPEGTRPGLAGGVPAGMRGVWVEASKVVGLADLRAGDHFDVLATTELKDTFQAAGRRLGDELVVSARSASLRPRVPEANVDAIVQNGILVRPMRTREVPVSTTGLMSGRRNVSVPVQEVFIAVRPQEMAPLTRALALGLDLRVALRSGRVGDDATETPSLRADSEAEDTVEDEFAVVEVIEGGRRKEVLRRRGDRKDGEKKK